MIGMLTSPAVSRTLVAGCAAAVLGAAALVAQPARTLDIYWIDVEGGASTLIVTPAGQSILMDAGFAGYGDRDPSRIERVVRNEAGLSRIDYLVTSHFHADHAGGIEALARRMPIGTFVDHGESVEKDNANGAALFEKYVKVAGSKRHVAKPGERLALKDVELIFVAADGAVLSQGLTGTAANPLCASFTPHPEDRGENGRSLGFLLRSGAFDFLTLGDLSWNFQQRLACPNNLLGAVDLFQATHHAVRDDVLPQQMWATAPTVTVMNNGPSKGAGAVAVETILRSPKLEDVWSLHRLLANDAAHNAPEPMTANLTDTDGCKGQWIRARVNGNGTFTLTNSRNNFSKSYRVRN
jgi:beta-lactamase superfamily II metal-dependent hydrolase